MAIDFPNSPVASDTYSASGKTWLYNGTSWTLLNTTGTVADGGISSSQLASAAVTAAKLASDAVTTAKILDSNVTAAKLASGAAATNLGYTPASTGKSIAMAIVFGS